MIREAVESNKVLKLFSIFTILIFGLFWYFVLSFDNIFLKFFVFIIPFIFITYYLYDIYPVFFIPLFFSLITIPDYKGRFTLFYGFMFIYLIVYFLRNIPTGLEIKKNEINKWLFLISIILIFTMMYRGVGFQILDEKTVGGFSYLQILGSIFFVLFFQNEQFSIKEWKLILVGLCVLGIMPFFIQILIGLNVISFNSIVVRSLNLSENIISSILNNPDILNTRFQLGNMAGVLLLLFFFIVKPLSKNDNRNVIFLNFGLILSILISGLSGHRIAIVNLLLLYTIYFYIFDKIKKIKLIVYIILIILFVFLLNFVIVYLPFPIQRAFSLIPFLNITSEAKELASITTAWRINLWNIALHEELPKYWLIGKGLAFNINENLPINISENYAWAIKTLNYHNGPLSIIITLGAWGLLATFGFLYSLLKRHINLLKKEWNSLELKNFHIAVLSFFISQVIIFLFIFGETNISLPRFLFLAALIESIAYSDEYFGGLEN